MKRNKSSRSILIFALLLLLPLFVSQVSEQQRKQLRELIRYQRAYNEQLEEARKQLLEKDEELQLVYSEMIDAERVYLEVSRQYEALVEKKLKADPTAKGIQAKLVKINEQIRSVGTTPNRPRP
tara:strand:- start:1135 stop:1506 length:372 start_codon:yes stop_codon:yes gene_type:complete